jgi:hypothetical protein
LLVEVPEFTFEVAQRVEHLRSDELLVKSLVIVFDLATTPRIIRAAEDQFDFVFLRFSFEDIGDE